MADEEPVSPQPRRRIWRWLLIGFSLSLAVALATVAINFGMIRSAREKTFSSSAKVPARDAAIVLGTSPKLRSKRANPFFESRLNAAAELWRGGQARHFIVSGDNAHQSYDEPTAMRDALMKRGVPASAITLDYAGFRTLDTMARASAVFGQKSVIVVTDDFHLPRALFLAKAHDLDAVGFRGRPVRLKWSMKTRGREVLSRVKAWLDVYVLNTQPKLLGPSVEVPSPGGGKR